MDAYKQSYEYALLAKDSVPLVHRLGNMARVYTQLGNIDSTIYYYHATIDLARQLGKENIKEECQLELADIYLQLGKLREARSLLNVNKRSGGYYSKNGKFYKQAGKLDSARLYLKKAAQIGDIYLKGNAYTHLYNIEKESGNKEAALTYLELASLYVDSARHITDTEGVKRVQALYAYQQFEKENNKLLLEVEQQKRSVILFFFTTVLLVVLILIYFFYKQRERKDNKEQKERASYFKQKRMSRSSDSHPLNTPTETQIDSPLQSDREKQHHSFFSSDIYFHLKQQADNESFRMHTEDWEKIREEIDKAYDQFSNRLYVLYPKLSEIEFRVCLLIKAGLTVTEIGHLVNRQKNSISSLRERLYMKIHRERGSSKELEQFILDF